ncbi:MULTISPECIES: hypothetical protein [Rhodomicrobium]|uniref:hypothetical protein n=1 Tax=Rhodomicrobium TaxID=1068 RepID=UPI00148298CF
MDHRIGGGEVEPVPPAFRLSRNTGALPDWNARTGVGVAGQLQIVHISLQDAAKFFALFRGGSATVCPTLAQRR